MKLYETYLPLVQSLNEYGGHFTAFHIRKTVLDAVDAGAVREAPLENLRRKLASKMAQWRGLQDHETFSEFFEAYYEAAFYLLARQRGITIADVPAGSRKGNTPDFRTLTDPAVSFEVKTIDVAAPGPTYDRAMEEGLSARIAIEEEARRRGVGSSIRTFAPHGEAKNRREAIEQIMKKIDSNVKAGQYEATPTFLVVSTVRTALHDRAENLRKHLLYPDQARPASGQLYAIAAHRLDEPFYFFREWGDEIVDLGPLGRAGVLRDHTFIAGLIFLATHWDADETSASMSALYSLNGIWNTAWERENRFGADASASAKRMFTQLCDFWNDVEDTRRDLLPCS
jgi:hypothetical protein